MQLTDILPKHWRLPRPSRRHLRLTKYLTKTSLSLLGYISLIMAASNPPKAAYIDYKTNELFNTITTPASNQCTNLPKQLQGVCQTSIGALSTSLNITQSDKLERYISGVTDYKNYVLFSSYEINVEGMPPSKTLGILGQFIPIETK